MSLQLKQSLQAQLGPGFEVRRELHGGGMSRVFVAHEFALKRDVVVKVLPPDLISSTSLARFRQEIEVTAQLQHPHILPVVTTGGSDTQLYYVMPYVAGGSLRDRLIAGELPTFEQGVRMTEELLTAVTVAHERGIVHRDIKPGNVLLSEGHAILADFGIARALQALDGSAENEGPTTSVASPEAYLAPERPADGAADLYALAVLSYEMLTGSLPMNVSASAITGALLDAHRNASPIRVRAVAGVLARALSRSPADRYPTAREFLGALRGTVEHRPRSVGSWTLAAGIVALAVAGGGVWLAGSRSAPPSDDRMGNPLVIAQGGASAPVIASAPPAVAPPVPAQPVSVAPAPTRASAASEQLQRALREAWSSSGPSWEAAMSDAIQALDDSASLSPRERQLALGIVALGTGAFPEACARFDQARALDDDFNAWMGLGECRLRDTVLVGQGDSLRFRSSFHDAAKAFLEAIRRAPPGAGGYPFTRLTSVAFTEPARVRRGWTDDGRVMLGRPFAVGDSFTFSAFAPGQPFRLSPEQSLANNRALTIAGNMLRPALLAYTHQNPTDTRVRLMLVELLESDGNIETGRADGTTALAEVEATRAIATADDPHAERLAEAHLRLLLRARRYEAAGRLADSIVALADTAAADALGSQLFTAAMVTGHAAVASRVFERMSGAAARLPRLRDGGVLRLPAVMMRGRASFAVAAALGVCTDEVRAAPARLLDMLDSYFSDGAVPVGAASAFLERPLLLALPCVGVDGARRIGEPQHPLGRALFARDEAERAQWTGRLMGMRAAQVGPQGAFLQTPENAMLDALVHLAARDSAAALASLTRMLDALPVLPSAILASEGGAGVAVRAMALAAELAAAAGDMADARKHAAAVEALWRHADEGLQPVVARMRAISGLAGN